MAARSYAAGEGPEERMPERPNLITPLWEARLPPEETGRQLSVAWEALDRHRRSPKREGAPYCRTPACTKACPACDLQCAVMTGCVYQLWQAHQRALAENGQTLQHRGRSYSVTAGNA